MFKRKKKDYFDFPPNYGYLGKLDQPVAQCPADKNITECSIVEQLRQKQAELKELTNEIDSIHIGVNIKQSLEKFANKYYGVYKCNIGFLIFGATKGEISKEMATEIGNSFLQYVDELERADELNKKIDQLKNEINNLKEQLGIM